MWNGNGASLLFSALLNPNSSRARRTVDYYRHWGEYTAQRGVELIPQIGGCSTGPTQPWAVPSTCPFVILHW